MVPFEARRDLRFNEPQHTVTNRNRIPRKIERHPTHALPPDPFLSANPFVSVAKRL
jgi:hypothetical protein